jgi:RNA polymerase sigma factor (sigma-70 family)
MSSINSVTQWIEQLRTGDDGAADRLWRRYYQRLVRLARRKLRDAPRRVSDEEDVATEAFASFCRATRDGRFPRLHDRDDLWRLIVRITEHKAIDGMRVQHRKKRGAGKVLDESVLGPCGDDASQAAQGIRGLAGPDPTPEQAAETAEAVGRLLGMLDAGLKRVALLKLEGHTNSEIAAAIERSVPTVERRLKYIRVLWEGM